jgi:hypothetical protein
MKAKKSTANTKIRGRKEEGSTKSDVTSRHPGIWAVMRFGQTTAKAVREIKQDRLQEKPRQKQSTSQ